METGHQAGIEGQLANAVAALALLYTDIQQCSSQTMGLAVAQMQ